MNNIPDNTENISLNENYINLLMEFLEVKKINTLKNYNVTDFMDNNFEFYQKQDLKIINNCILYNCNIKCHVFDGNGIIVLPGGAIYDGMFTNGFPNFYGKITYSNGNYYIGEWKNGLKNGKGTFYIDEQNKYTGNWMNNKKHGEGKKYENGELYYVHFNSDILLNKLLYFDYLKDKEKKDLNVQLKNLNDIVVTFTEKFYLEKKKNSLMEIENIKTVKQLENMIFEKTQIIENCKNNEIETELEKSKIINEDLNEKINSFQKEYDLAISQYSSQVSKYEEYIGNLKNHYENKVNVLQEENSNSLKRLETSIKKNEDIKKKYNCKICLSNESNILLMPCKHIAMCQSCEFEHHRISGPICPICRARYYDVHKIYI